MLSVEFQKFRAEVSKRRARRERIIDERAAPALCGNFAANDDVPPGGVLENCLDDREWFASSDEVARGATAHEQTDRFDQYGLPGAGFPCQNVQPRLEFDFEMIDDREIAHAEEAQHVVTGTLIVSDL